MKDNDGEILASIENKRIGKLEIKAEEPGIIAIAYMFDVGRQSTACVSDPAGQAKS